jgi:hypothetical protein
MKTTKDREETAAECRVMLQIETWRVWNECLERSGCRRLGELYVACGRGGAALSGAHGRGRIQSEGGGRGAVPGEMGLVGRRRRLPAPGELPRQRT